MSTYQASWLKFIWASWFSDQLAMSPFLSLSTWNTLVNILKNVLIPSFSTRLSRPEREADFYQSPCKHFRYRSKDTLNMDGGNGYRLWLWQNKWQGAWHLGLAISPRKPWWRVCLHYWSSACCTFLMYSMPPCDSFYDMHWLLKTRVARTGWKEEGTNTIPCFLTKLPLAYWWPPQDDCMRNCHPWHSWWIFTKCLYT